MNIDNFIEILEQGYPLSEKYLRMLCRSVIDILAEESNIQHVKTPINVCGNINGKIFDLFQLFKQGGSIPKSSYVFTGGYVNRGYSSVETIQYLFCLKIKFPKSLTLLRGNHECRTLTQVYGFYDEIKQKYGNLNVWKYIVEVFDYLPIGAVINGLIFCVHSGLSPEITKLDQLSTIERKQEVPQIGPLCDLLWSEPDEIETWQDIPKGYGFYFGAKIAKQFCHINNLILIIRSHQLHQDGYQFMFPEKSLLTLWSSPNYCQRCDNKAAILLLNEQMNKQIKIFEECEETKKHILTKLVKFPIIF